MKKVEELREKVRGKKVLFVDDEKEIRDGTGIFLRKFFDDVVICADGSEGLEVFMQEKDFDIVITDILMPKMDGIEMVKEIKKIDADVFIVIITASRSIFNIEKGLSDVSLKKPISFDDILLVIQKIVDLK